MKMRDYDENYLELAAGYMNDGLFAEAADILWRFKGTDQMVSYYLGYILDKKGQKAEAEKYFRSSIGNEY